MKKYQKANNYEFLNLQSVKLLRHCDNKNCFANAKIKICIGLTVTNQDNIIYLCKNCYKKLQNFKIIKKDKIKTLQIKLN